MWEYFNTSVHFNENFIQIKTPPKPESQTTVIKSLKYQKKLVICIHKEIEIYSQTCMFLSELSCVITNETFVNILLGENISIVDFLAL